MADFIEEVYKPMLLNNGFTPDPENTKFNSMGTCWKLSPEIGEGYYWTYGKDDLYDIRIHDFAFHEDTLMDFDLPESLNVSYYESISGEELHPYRHLDPGCIKTFCGGSPYRIMIHKKIPVRSTCIEIMPDYYNHYLKTLYPEGEIHPKEIFSEIDQTMEFYEMAKLIMQVKNYRGDGIAAKLFYEGKVAETISLMVDWHLNQKRRKNSPFSTYDKIQIEGVTGYLNDHFALNLSLEQLARIACMSPTKLKYTFKQYHGCTIMGYIQQKRISQAEHLLTHSDLSISQIARAVGYSSSSRFSELFRKNTGLQPRVYRESIRCCSADDQTAHEQATRFL